MPDRRRVIYPFYVWLQRDYEAVDGHDIQYSSDGRTVTCWLPEDFMQDANTLRWESNGLGHPCKIRILTERAHATTRLGQNGNRASVDTRRTASEPYTKHRTSTERSHLRRHTTGTTHFMPLAIAYSNRLQVQVNYGHLEVTKDNRILTIKVEVLLPSQRVPPKYASGCLPINGKQNKLCIGVNKAGCLAPRVPKRHASHPYRSSHGILSSVEPPRLGIPKRWAGQPLLPLTFYFRAQPRSIQRRTRLADCPSTYPYLKADYCTKIQIPPSPAPRIPSQYQQQLVDREALSTTRLSEQIEDQSTRGDSNSVTSDGYTELDPRSTAPTKVVVSFSNASKSPQSGELRVTTDTESSDSEISKLPRYRTQPETRDVAVQTVSLPQPEPIAELEESHIKNTRPRCRNCEMSSELDRLLTRMQQSTLELHAMASSLRKMTCDSHQGPIMPL